MIVNTNSWHYKFLRKIQFSALEIQHMDSCEYIHSVLSKGFFVLLGGFTVATCVIGFFYTAIGFFYTAIGYWLNFFFGVEFSEKFLEIGFIVNAIFLTMVVVVIVAVITDKLKKRAASSDSPPGFFAQAQDRIKNKFCSKLEIVSDQD